MIKPARNNIVVRLDDNIANNGGFIIPPTVDKWRSRDGSIEGENRGTVVSVGPGAKNKRGLIVPMEAKPGDVIRFGELEFYNWKENGHKYVLISENDILWIEESEKAA